MVGPGKNRIILFFVTAICLFGIGDFLLRNNTVHAATDATIAAMEQKIDDIQRKKGELQEKIDIAKSNRAEAYEYKNYIDRQLNLTLEEIDTINALVSELENKASETEALIKKANESIDGQYENFKQIMRLTYEEGEVSFMEIVLGAEDLYDFLIRIEQVSSIMDYSSNLLDEYRGNKATLESSKIALEESKASQLKYKGELELRKAELDVLKNENETLLSDILKDIDAYTASYNKYAEEEKKLDREIEAYLKELQAKDNSAYVGGEFAWPLPVNYRSISSPYGWRTLNGKREFHAGIDIPAPGGTKIYASNGGKVVTATFHQSYGNYVLIDHGGGKATLYAHATALNCKKGDVVNQGDVIAFVGTTGHSYGNHLHFEVRINGTKNNPLNFLKKP